MLPARFRRKFLVEFTVEESDLLDRLGREHGSRRAAILAGLKLLAGGELDALRGQVAALQRDLASGQAQHERDAAALAAAERGRVRAGALQAEKSAHTKTRAQLKTVGTQLQEATDRLTTVQAAYQGLNDELPEQAYCASCRRLVPRDEWAVEATDLAVYLYHRNDGFRLMDGGIGGKRATVFFSRSTSGNSTG